MVSYRGLAWLVLAACALGGSAAAAHADCVADIGVVLPLTGPIAAVAQGMVKSADLAAEQINAAGGVNGCKVALLMRDSQGQPSLAVDAARQLVDVSHVGAIVGEALTGPTMAILTSVTAPSGTVLLSPTASAPTFSAIGAKTGLFFRTNVSDALQGVAAASYARREQAGRVAILAVNNDWGKNLSQVFGTAYQALGGPAPKIEFYNPGQSSYRAEVTSLIGDDPDSFYLIGYAAEGAGIVRDWLSQGGTQRLIFAHNLNDAKFVAAVGAKFLRRAVWLTPGESETPSLKDFDAAYTARYKEPAAGPGRTGTYDVVGTGGTWHAGREDYVGWACHCGGHPQGDRSCRRSGRRHDRGTKTGTAGSRGGQAGGLSRRGRAAAFRPQRRHRDSLRDLEARPLRAAHHHRSHVGE